MLLPMFLRFRWLCLFMLVFGSGCMPPTDSPTPVPTSTQPVKIELDVFSGRPNPEWSLSAADETYLLEKLQNAAAVPAKSFEQPLGYRGMVVYVSGNPPAIYRVWKDFISKDIEGKVTMYADDHRALEMWLLVSGKPSLEADLFQTIQGEIEKNE
jgi:hypothetical protein